MLFKWYTYLHSGSNCLAQVACLWSKMSMFQSAEMREGGLPLPPAFQYLIFVTWNACDLNLVVISSLDSKWQDVKFGCPFFSCFMKRNWKPLGLKSWHFEAKFKFKSQGLDIIGNRYCNAGGSGNPPFLTHSCSLELRHFTS